MEKATINNLKLEYEHKREKSKYDLEKRKEEIYLEIPRLLEIEKELNNIAIQTTKNILISNSLGKENILEELEINIKKLKDERNIILQQIKKDNNFLELEFECEKCKDTGYITNTQETKMCNCLKQKMFDISYNKSNISNLKKENFDLFDFKMFSDEIDNKKYKAEISPRENIKLIKNMSDRFIENFKDSEEKSLFFTGNPGTGKTFISNCIAKEILESGHTVLYQTAPVLFDTIISYRFNKTDNISDIYENILSVDLLIIDDLGTETVNTITLSELFNIVNTRYLNQNNKVTKTIISSNLSISELFSKYDERIMSRIVGNYNICKFFGDDIRLVKKGIKLTK